MRPLNRVVKELQAERNRLEKELERVEAAIRALLSLNSRGRGQARASIATGRPRRRMSAAARRRIANAQRARSAKLREQRQKSA